MKNKQRQKYLSFVYFSKPKTEIVFSKSKKKISFFKVKEGNFIFPQSQKKNIV